MPLFDHTEFDHHENVIYCQDEHSGLRGIIAIHNTTLGPAAGGCRMHPYDSEEDALADVLRLSRGMSYKNAAAGLELGGGKAVIIADPRQPDKADLLRAFSHHVQALGGRYWSAIDVGVGPEDADILAENCDYIFARASQFPDGFNPSLFTALGGFTALRASVSHVWNRTDLTGLRVAVQGLGATGRDLCRQLHEAGATLLVADVNDQAVQFVVDHYDATVIEPNDIHAQAVDVFAPCAMGAVINDHTIDQIRAKVVCGLANNQLAAPGHDQALRDRGITYVPDFVANAGGVMGSATMIYSQPTREASMRNVLTLFDSVSDILQTADQQNQPTSAVAEAMASERIATAHRT